MLDGETGLQLLLCDSVEDATALRDAGFRSIRIVTNAEQLYVVTEEGYVLDATLALFDRFVLTYAVRVYGVDVVMIDPVNEIDHNVPKFQSKTDYMGHFIMALKALADDYNLLVIVAAHPPKDGVEKRLTRGKLLTLNDGADTAHWGNKADIGWAVWRPDMDGPTLLHVDKLRDHETMGKPTLAELTLDKRMNRFAVSRIGYDILSQEGAV